MRTSLWVDNSINTKPGISKPIPAIASNTFHAIFAKAIIMSILSVNYSSIISQRGFAFITINSWLDIFFDITFSKSAFEHAMTMVVLSV